MFFRALSELGRPPKSLNKEKEHTDQVGHGIGLNYGNGRGHGDIDSWKIPSNMTRFS